jgi:hypothetical protein
MTRQKKFNFEGGGFGGIEETGGARSRPATIGKGSILCYSAAPLRRQIKQFCAARPVRAAPTAVRFLLRQ